MARIHPRVVVATRAQLQARRKTLEDGAEHVGWKIALGIEEVEALVGADPVLGHITTATLLEPGGTFAGADAARQLRAQTELAIEVGPEETVAGLAVALEILDTGRPPDGLEEIIIANVYHRGVAFGPTHAVATISPATASLLVGGQTGEVAPLSTAPGETVSAVARLLGAAGERLRPGDRILAGSACHVPVQAGDEVVAEIDGLGAVALRIA